MCIQKLKKDYDGLVKSQASAKKQLEDETIMRVDLENRIQSLKEELAFASEVHKQVSGLILLTQSLNSVITVCVMFAWANQPRCTASLLQVDKLYYVSINATCIVLLILSCINHKLNTTHIHFG